MRIAAIQMASGPNLQANLLEAERLIGRLAWIHGLRPTPAPVRAGDLIDGFRLEGIRPRPEGIVVDPSTWEVAPSGESPG